MKNFIKDWVEDHFGSKRGLARKLKYQALLWIGCYNESRRIDCQSIDRLIFICSGNICRSPFAEFYAESIGLRARSYGLHCPDGDPADPRAIDFAHRQGIDMSSHETLNICQYRPQKGDLLLVMEPQQLRELESVLEKTDPNRKVESSILPLFADSPSAYLHDPYNTTPSFFDHCERQVMAAVDGIARRMKETAQ